MSTGGVLPWFEIQPLPELQNALLLANWHRVHVNEGLFELWSDASREEIGGRSVLVPLDPGKGDFESLVAQAWDHLGQILGPVALGRIREHAVRQRELNLIPSTWKREARTAPGTIPWVDGQEVHDSITRQLMAAARATLKPGPVLGRANAYFARDFLENVILAPSGTGSYVVTALTAGHAPVFIADPTTNRARPVESVPAVNVIRTLDSALGVITSALGQSKEEDAVEDLVRASQWGVSQELVVALTEFIRDQDAAVILPRHAWDPGALRSEHVFNPPNVPVLERVAAKLSRHADSTRQALVGVVTQMAREPDQEGEIRIFTTSQGPIRRVRLRLGVEHYTAALEAHGDEALVRVSGELRKDGKFWRMDFPETFLVLSDERASDDIDDLLSGEDPPDIGP
jgi:hypothetical protein